MSDSVHIRYQGCKKYENKSVLVVSNHCGRISLIVIICNVADSIDCVSIVLSPSEIWPSIDRFIFKSVKLTTEEYFRYNRKIKEGDTELRSSPHSARNTAQGRWDIGP